MIQQPQHLTDPQFYSSMNNGELATRMRRLVDEAKKFDMADHLLLEAVRERLLEADKARVGAMLDEFRAAGKPVPQVILIGPQACGKTQVAKFIKSQLHLEVIEKQT